MIIGHRLPTRLVRHDLLLHDEEVIDRRDLRSCTAIDTPLNISTIRDALDLQAARPARVRSEIMLAMYSASLPTPWTITDDAA